MHRPIHADITREALDCRFSPRALEIIIAANLKQDSLPYQIGHDKYHFDNNSFEASNRYIVEQRGTVLTSLFTSTVLPAWAAFGRLTHAVQDFYAHTNYAALWLDRHRDSPPPSPPEIDPVDKGLLDSPRLRSGKLYYPLEALYFIPGLRKLALAALPRDSHARMNLDSDESGPLFAYARAAAVKRTKYEFEILEKLLPPELFSRFTDL